MLATPSQTLRENLTEWAPYVEPGATFVSLMKGVELGTLERMSQVIAEVTGAGPERIAVISGPNLAKEIARREPAASVVACEDEDVAKMLQARCHSPAFRPYTSVDVLGCELGGAYKNVVALSVGMAVGLGLRRQHHGLADHPRPRRDRAARDGARRQPADADGAGRARRPGRHLLLAAVAQPDLRREARPGHDDRRRSTPRPGRSPRARSRAPRCSPWPQRTGVDAPIAHHVDALVDGRMTAEEMMDAFIARDTKAETTD